MAVLPLWRTSPLLPFFGARVSQFPVTTAFVDQAGFEPATFHVLRYRDYHFTLDPIGADWFPSQSSTTDHYINDLLFRYTIQASYYEVV